MSSFSSTTSTSSYEHAPMELSQTTKDFDASMRSKRGAIVIINPETGSPIKESAAHIAKIAEVKAAKEASYRTPLNHKVHLSKAITITAPPTPYTRWATPAESSAAAKAARAKASELSAQAQRRRAAFAAIERAQDERRAREAAEAEKEEEQNAALMKLLGCE